MMENTRRRSDRSSPVRGHLERGLEALEERKLLRAHPYVPFAVPERTIEHANVPIGVAHPIGQGLRTLASLDNDGRYITGKDRQGDEYILTIHGPGALIVTDATPNDGALDDDLSTITIVGSDPKKTYVTGQVTASARLITDGTVNFNRLIAERGVKSIILNGFNLTRTTVPPILGQPNNTGPEIYLPGGVEYLSFNNIIADIDVAAGDQPIDVVIGDPTTPLKVHPTIKVGNIFNTVFNSSLGFAPAGQPPTTPTVDLMVNGTIHLVEFVSATTRAFSGADPYVFPTVGATGQTLVRTNGIKTLRSIGSARNFVTSRGGPPFQAQNGQQGAPDAAQRPTRPFQNGFTGMRFLKHASFGGVADGVGLDVNGPIGTVRFARGLGDPTGAVAGATNLGGNPAQFGNAAYGLLGGLVVGRRIKHVVAGAANVTLQAPQDPDYVQLDRTGSTKYYARAGNALTNVAIVSSDSIGKVTIVGNTQATEVKSGAHYYSYVAGLEPTRAPSRIGKVRQRGDLVDAVVSATYRPGADRFYKLGDALDPLRRSDDVAGPGVIKGNLQHGSLFLAGNQTPLGNYGTGFHARRKEGHLPPPETPKRVNSALLRT